MPSPGAEVAEVRMLSSASKPLVVTPQLHLQRGGPSPGPRRVVMVDDVFTHGRISSACSDVSLRAGLAEVVITCIARTKL